MSDVAWLFVAFMAVWTGIGAYVLYIGFRQRALEKRLKQIESRSLTD